MSEKGTVFVALFSGINVGGNRIVKMVELRAFFEDLGFSDVASYVQSGNVVFRSKKGDAATLKKQIEAAFEKKWGFHSRIMVRDAGWLRRLLIAAGLTMQWSDPAKGTLKADGLEVKAEQAGRATRVTFLSSVGADKDVLCRYAGFVGSPASEMPPPVPQDPSLIAQMKTDLLKKQKVLQADTGYGPSTVTFHSQDDFADFKITAVKETADERRYEISVLLPSEACILARENVDDAAAGFGGATETPKTQPVRASVSLTYRSDAGVWHLADAAISHIERTK